MECRTTLEGIVDLLYNEPSQEQLGLADGPSDGLIGDINGELDALKGALEYLKQELLKLHRRLS